MSTSADFDGPGGPSYIFRAQLSNKREQNPSFWTNNGLTMILTIDLGTTYFKFTLFDRAGRMVRTVRVAPDVASPEPGWRELDADQFVATVDNGVCQVLAGDDGRRHEVAAVSFATQTNSFLLLDVFDQPLTPIIFWPDARSREFTAEASDHASPRASAATTGVPAVTSEFMVAKLLWLSRHRPDIWSKTVRVCLVSDYLTMLATGAHVTEAGAAGLTGLLDVRARQWWHEALECFSVPAEWLPKIVVAGTDLGPLLPRIRDRWGLSPHCRFIVGCLDQYAGCLGVGNVAPNVVSETTGTVLSAIRCSRELNACVAPGVFQGSAYRAGLYYQMAFGNVAANYLHWYRQQLPDQPEFSALSNLAATVGPGAEELRIDRHKATPAEALSGLIDLPRGQVVRAIMEAVAFALREHVARLHAHTEISLSEIRSAGGGARSDVWLQIKADVLGVPVRATSCPEPTSLGAAILAEAALAHASVAGVAEDWVDLRRPCLPDRENHHRYQAMRNA